MSPARKPTKTAAPSAKEAAARSASALARIPEMDDADGLRALLRNAERLDADDVREAAFRRLAFVQTDVEAEPGSLAHDFWQTIHAFEQLMREEKGKAVRLTRVRQKITRVGEVKTLADFATATAENPAFAELIARGMSDLTGEAVILRHPDEFTEDTRAGATARLTEAGADPTAFAA
ncbi:hypothetical protein ATO2_01155 [Roseovarius sp. 22II1-1F6A]|nr:hypothetical protein [Actibacterium sp.]OWU71954.1 hypothetical protein ATO2_01155 [Roseovarius sp. 22II1-1F6A]|tara:strand:+ start:171 stop:704 length:534 start_codon:yes stop_codon:yes gene_type:complete